MIAVHYHLRLVCQVLILTAYLSMLASVYNSVFLRVVTAVSAVRSFGVACFVMPGTACSRGVSYQVM